MSDKTIIVIVSIVAFTILVLVLGILILRRRGAGDIEAEVNPIQGTFKFRMSTAEVREAVKTVARSFPEISKLVIQTSGQPTFEQFPVYMNVSDPRLRFVAIRVELEARLRNLALVMGLDRDQEVSGLVNSLAGAGVYGRDTAKALLDLLHFGDDVSQGADVDLEAFREPQVTETLHKVLWAIAHRATIVQQERDRAARTAEESGESELSWANQALAAAAVDDKGNIVYRHISTTSGQAVVVPIDKDGSVLTFWIPEDTYPESFRKDSVQDEEGNVLATMISTPGGFAASPVDAHLQPTIGTLVGLADRQGEIHADPERGFLDSLPPASPPQESSSEQSQGEQFNAPSWLTEQLSRGAQDKFGYLVTRRMRAVDGGWADVTVDQDDRPLQFWVDMDDISQPPKEGANRELMTFIVALGGKVLVPFDPEGQRPAYSPHAVEQHMREQPPLGTNHQSQTPSQGG